MAELTDREKQEASRDPRETVQLIRAWYQEDVKAYEADHAAMAREMSYAFDLNHWQGALNQQSRVGNHDVFQPAMPEIHHQVRHKIARIAKAEVYPNCYPVDDYGDADTAEDAQHILEQEKEVKRFNVYYRRAIAWQVAGRAGALELYAQKGPFGDEVYVADLDPRLLLIPNGFFSPHDTRCPRVIRLRPVRIEEVRAKMDSGEWKKQDVKPDIDFASQRPQPGLEPLEDGICSVKSVPKGIVWTAEAWIKQDGALSQPKEISVKLPKEQYYMACETCGQPDEMQGRGPMLPKWGTPCPDCGGETQRVEKIKEMRQARAYPKFRLVVTAINQPWLEPFYDDTGPQLEMDDGTIRGLRTFPFAILRNTEDPRQLYGASDPFLHCDQQNMINETYGAAYWQMKRNRDWLLTIEGGLLGPNKAPFEPSTDPSQYMINAANQIAFQGTRYLQGSGMSPAFPNFLAALRESWNVTSGNADFSQFTAEAKNVPGVTLEQYKETGEIPQDDTIDRNREELGPFFGDWYDYWIITSPVEKMIRKYGPDGALKFKRLMASDMPQMDVIISAQPRLEAARVKEASEIADLLMRPEPIRSIVWKRLNLPMEELNKANQMVPQGTPIPGMPGGQVQPGGGVPAAIAQRMNPLQGGGANGGVQYGG